MRAGLQPANVRECVAFPIPHRIQVLLAREYPYGIATADAGPAVGGNLDAVTLGQLAEGLALRERTRPPAVPERDDRFSVGRRVAGNRGGSRRRPVHGAGGEDPGRGGPIEGTEAQRLVTDADDVALFEQKGVGDLQVDAVRAVQIAQDHPRAGDRDGRMAARQMQVVRRQRDVRRPATDDLRALTQPVAPDQPSVRVVMRQTQRIVLRAEDDPLPAHAREGPGRHDSPPPLRHVQEHAVRRAFVAHPVAVGSRHDGRVPLGQIRVVRKADVAALPADGADAVAGKLEGLGFDLAVDEADEGGGPGRRWAVRTTGGGRQRRTGRGSACQLHLDPDVGSAAQPLADGLDHRDAVGHRCLDVAAMLDLAKRRGVAAEVAALEVRGVEGVADDVDVGLAALQQRAEQERLADAGAARHGVDADVPEERPVYLLADAREHARGVERHHRGGAGWSVGTRRPDLQAELPTLSGLHDLGRFAAREEPDVAVPVHRLVERVLERPGRRRHLLAAVRPVHRRVVGRRRLGGRDREHRLDGRDAAADDAGRLADVSFCAGQAMGDRPHLARDVEPPGRPRAEREHHVPSSNDAVRAGPMVAHVSLPDTGAAGLDPDELDADLRRHAVAAVQCLPGAAQVGALDIAEEMQLLDEISTATAL